VSGFASNCITDVECLGRAPGASLNLSLPLQLPTSNLSPNLLFRLFALFLHHAESLRLSLINSPC
jgi:hypothetical protein